MRGYKHFIIQPVPDGSLTHVKGSYHSIAGRIGVPWKKEKENFTMDVGNTFKYNGLGCYSRGEYRYRKRK